MDEYGQVSDYSLWGDDAIQDLVDEAHAHGVRLVVTIQNFNDPQIVALLSDPARRATAIQTCLTLIAMHGADGVNIDFERVSLSVKNEFVTFMTDLKDAVDAAQPAGTPGHVTLAGPAIDGAGAYDFDQLLIHTDGIFIMGYDYYWGTSQPGPTAPFTDSATWGNNYSLTWSVEDYLKWGGEENRSKIILGLPLYGHIYNVADTSIPGVNLDPEEYIHAMSTGAFQTFAANNGGEVWDEDASAVYAHGEHKGRFAQAWNENLTSLGMKMDLVTQYDLGGVGFWALGFEEGFDGFWGEVADQFGTVEPDPVDPPDTSDGPDSSDASDAFDTGAAPDSQDTDGEETSADLGPELEADEVLGEVSDEVSEEPEATLGATSSQTTTTRSTQSGCSGGDADSSLPWLALVFTVLLLAPRPRER